MKQDLKYIPWQGHKVNDDFANFLLLNARNSKSTLDDGDDPGLSLWNEKELMSAQNKFIFSTRYKVLYNINAVAGARSKNIGKISFVEFDDQGTNKKFLVPYQFTGLVTAPKDVRFATYNTRSFFGRLLENFIKFLALPIFGLYATWEALRNSIIKDGNPNNIVGVHKEEKELKDRKDDIIQENPNNNPLIPPDFIPRSLVQNGVDPSPDQSGFGIFITLRSNPADVYQLFDSESILDHEINKRDNVIGWELPHDVFTLMIKWISNNGYAYNDGECYGSFTLNELAS
ncbi:MAG: hypothetical protein V4572_04965 [Bacteroidota bacterium]